MRSRIAGTGSYLPARVVGNGELAALVGEDSASIGRSTGIETRHFAAADEAASDLALHAAAGALEASHLRPDDIDCVIFATHTPDYYFPGSGCILAAKLGRVGIPALDVRNQCSGFLYALSIADHFIRLGTYRRVLVVAAEVMSGGLELSPRGREAAVRFSDGAAAVVMVPELDEHRGVQGAGLHADGRFARSLMLEVPGSAHREPIAEHVAAGRHLPVAGGFEVIEEGCQRLREAAEEALATCGLTAEDITLLIPNAGSVQMARLVCRRLRLPRERLYANLEQHGNATGASLPICLDELVRAGRVGRGDVLLFLAFGSGFSWAWVVVRW